MARLFLLSLINSYLDREFHGELKWRQFSYLTFAGSLLSQVPIQSSQGTYEKSDQLSFADSVALSRMARYHRHSKATAVGYQ